MYGPQYYYILDSCISSESKACQGRTAVTVPTGSYNVFCDFAQDPDKCSGNPVCTINRGGIECTGWKACSSSAYKTITVAVPVEPTLRPGEPTRTPTPTGQQAHDGAFGIDSFNPCDLGLPCATPAQ